MFKTPAQIKTGDLIELEYDAGREAKFPVKKVTRTDAWNYHIAFGVGKTRNGRTASYPNGDYPADFEFWVED